VTFRYLALAAVSALVATLIWVATAGPAGAENAPGSDSGRGPDAQLIIYNPPLPHCPTGAPPETLGAGTRLHPRPPVEGGRGVHHEVRPRRCSATVQALVPVDSLGLTVHAQPVLLWYLSKDTECRIDLTLSDPRRPECELPLAEKTLAGPLRKGIHAVQLESLGVHLEPGVSNVWAVEVVENVEHRARNEAALARVRRISPRVELRADQSTTLEIASSYAANGVWCDAIATLFDGIGRDPKNDVLRRAWRELLDQVGLASIAGE